MSKFATRPLFVQYFPSTNVVIVDGVTYDDAHQAAHQFRKNDNMNAFIQISEAIQRASMTSEKPLVLELPTVNSNSWELVDAVSLGIENLIRLKAKQDVNFTLQGETIHIPVNFVTGWMLESNIRHILSNRLFVDTNSLLLGTAYLSLIKGNSRVTGVLSKTKVEESNVEFSKVEESLIKHSHVVYSEVEDSKVLHSKIQSSLLKSSFSSSSELMNCTLLSSKVADVQGNFLGLDESQFTSVKARAVKMSGMEASDKELNATADIQPYTNIDVMLGLASKANLARTVNAIGWAAERQGDNLVLERR